MSTSAVRLLLVVAFQASVLAVVPARQVLARAGGQDVTLATGPFDPFSPFAGHFVVLSYDVERPAPRQAAAGLAPGDLVYVTVERAEPAWRLVSVDRERPPAAPGRASLRARWTHYERAELESAGRFYLPQAEAQRVTKLMQEEMERRWAAERAARARGEHLEPVLPAIGLVDLRVDGAGNVALMRLRVGGVAVEY